MATNILSLTRLTFEPLRHCFILTLLKTPEGDPQHRLNPTLINSLRYHLKYVKDMSKNDRGSVLITTAQGDSFCEGFDFSYARNLAGGTEDKACKEMNDGFKDLVKDLISLPMPTIAAINGYATEAGLMLALSHDHLTMKRVGDLYLRTELLSRKRSYPYPSYFATLIRSKVGCPLARRKLLLRDLQINAEHAAKFGLLDWDHEVGSEKDALGVAKAQADELSKKDWNGELYAKMRQALHPELCKELELTCSQNC